jgi:hypothetical protein
MSEKFIIVPYRLRISGTSLRQPTMELWLQWLIGVLLALLSVCCWLIKSWPQPRPVRVTGLDKTISLPHTHPVELYYNEMSKHSLKVR